MKNNILLIVLIIALVLISVIFKENKVEVNYEHERLHIIEMVKNNELKVENNSVLLPKEYKYLSKSGEIIVYVSKDDEQLIGFWLYRGMLSGSDILVYSTFGEELIKKYETNHPITNIEKLKENWYYVETEY